MPQLNIVNQHLHFEKVLLIEPSKNHFLHIAAEIDTPLFLTFIFTSVQKKQIIEQGKQWCKHLEDDMEIVNATVFKARLIPPGQGKFIEKRKDQVHIARFDFAILIEARSFKAIEKIKNSNTYKEIISAIETASAFTHIITATNVKQIGAVNHKRQGVFLFNYFFSDNLQQNLAVWEYTAGWFQQETGLDNSTVLLPKNLEQSSYKIINHCRWNKMSEILPSLIFKKSFHSYVLNNFYENNVAAMPVLYKIA